MSQSTARRRPSVVRSTRALALLVAVLLSVAAAFAAPAVAASGGSDAVHVVAPGAASGAALAARSGRVRHFAPEAKAKIHPGTMMYTNGAQCTANFVFTDNRGHVYVGYAAHCAGTGSSTDTNGCQTRSLPTGTAVTFRRNGNLATEGSLIGRGTLAYSSWATMRRIGTTAANPCAYNDLALVKVAGGSVKKVNPTVPFWGGPTGIDRNGVKAGDRVFTYGNSSIRGGATVLSPHTGLTFGDRKADGGWTHALYTVSPGIPGDSGSGFMTRGGKAIGVLSTLGLAPQPLSNNIGDLAKELAFAQKHSGIPGLQLVKGTRGFSSTPTQLP